MTHSSGIILWKDVYENDECKPYIFLAHSTGHDLNLWSFPKGEGEFPETLLECAKREFQEETSFNLPNVEDEEFIYLGKIQQNKDKIVHAYALKYEKIDPKKCKSNWCEFPIGTGKMIPELDDYKWFSYEEALKVINKKQIPLLEFFYEYLESL